jgi:hypothetical protein
MGWRRLWDGRGGAQYAKWKLKKEMEQLYHQQKEFMRHIGTPSASEDEDSDGSATSDVKAARAAKRKAATKEYDIPASYSDPRQRNFEFAPDTGSENEQDALEKENLELSSESEFVPSDAEAAAGGSEDDGSHEDDESEADEEDQ